MAEHNKINRMEVGRGFGGRVGIQESVKMGNISDVTLGLVLSE